MEVTLGIWVNEGLIGGRLLQGEAPCTDAGAWFVRRRYPDVAAAITAGDNVSLGAGDDRDRVTVAEIAGEAGGARADQGAEETLV